MVRGTDLARIPPSGESCGISLPDIVRTFDMNGNPRSIIRLSATSSLLVLSATSSLLVLFAFVVGCERSSMRQATTRSHAAQIIMNWNPEERIEKTDAEWKAELTPEQFRVLRKHGTERPFSGELWNTKDAGTYVCAACGLALFDADHKFDSGTGWPSYWQPIEEKHVGTKTDRSFFMTRTEVHCARCGGHLGHIFDDGPKPTGLRYCINSVSLDFVPKSDPSEPSE